ncbi:hypothetical protein KQI85_07160 [Falcatimonas sp. MSJ-15]|uniref:hypothetical protein n=1 Tax=Falcatimonas sp. MSJ-15 TaxID=2841515 RepID=UPI001C117FB7|nr:hypothetical protein [Falcatimonas sp. MSJ-15]MBU5470146.1 hypothetical protein [Falcatimonas sp. MSJ-15]
MTTEVLSYIDSRLKQLNINYAFMRHENHPGYPYCVGEYREVDNNCEDKSSESVFTLAFFTRNTWIELLTMNELIKSRFDNKIVRLSDGHTAAFYYEGHNLIDDEDPNLKRMELTIRIKEWSE